MPQAAFIYNATVRENILFGLPYEEQRYQRAIQGASLGPDLLLLTGAKLQVKALGVVAVRWALSEFASLKVKRTAPPLLVNGFAHWAWLPCKGFGVA